MTQLSRQAERLAVWLADFPRLTRVALDWWVAGLVAPLPPSWRAKLVPAAKRIVVRCAADDLTARWSDANGAREIRLADGATFSAALAELAAPPDARAIVVLDPAACLRRRLALPSGAARTLRGVLDHEVARLTPIPKEDLSFQYRVARFEPAQKRVLVDIYVTRASLVERLRSRLVAGGWPLDAVVPASGDDGDVPINFIRGRERSSLRFPGHWTPRWPTAVATAAVAAWLFLPALRYDSLLARAEARIDETRAAALASRSALDERDALLAREQFLDRRRAEYVPVLNVLRELTGLAPQDTWLQQLDVQGSKLQLQGDTPNASAVLQILEDSPLFANATFVAPISPLPDAGKERFVVSLEVAGEDR